MAFELNLSKSKINPQTLPTTKIRSLFPISEKIRRRAFVLNSQEHQRHEKFMSHVDLQEKLQGLKFGRVRRSLQSDIENYEVYKRALYNIGRRQIELGLLKPSPAVHSPARGAPRRLPPVSKSLPEHAISESEEAVQKADRKKNEEDKRKEIKGTGDNKDERKEIKGSGEDKKEIDITNSRDGSGIMIVTAAEIQDHNFPGDKTIRDENVTENVSVREKGDLDGRLIDEVRQANLKLEATAKKRKKAKIKLAGDRYCDRRTPKANMLPPYGLYGGKVYRHLSKERRDAHFELDPTERRKRQAGALLANAQAQSSVLIDRKMPTSALLRSSRDLPLKARLRPSAALKLKPIKAKMQAIQAFMKVRENALVQKEIIKDTDRFGRGVGLVKRKDVKDGAFKTKIWDGI